jgi:hypothetical protein
MQQPVQQPLSDRGMQVKSMTDAIKWLHNSQDFAKMQESNPDLKKSFSNLISAMQTFGQAYNATKNQQQPVQQQQSVQNMQQPPQSPQTEKKDSSNPLVV